MIAEVIIASQFRGPPTSGNGGYCSGLMAEYLPGAVRTRMRAPIPLDRPLQVVAQDPGLALIDPETEAVLMTAWEEPLDLDVAPLPDLAKIAVAKKNYQRAEDADFSECFGCGAGRDPGDGIRVIATPMAAGQDWDGTTVDLWHAHPNFAGPDGTLAQRYIWTVLDCSGAYSAGVFTDKSMLTGEMHIHHLQPIKAGQDYIPLFWPIRQDGRKIETGAAFYDHNGELYAIGKVLWIVLKDQ